MGRWQAKTFPHLLGAQLVHRQGRSQDAATGVRDTQAFEQALHAAVFAAATMQNDKSQVDLFPLQNIEQIVAHINTEHVDASVLQGAQHLRAGFERHFPFSALAAVQHGHPAKIRWRKGRKQRGVGANGHFNFPGLATAPANKGLLSSCGANAPMSPAPWHSRMSPARSSGLTNGASSTPRSM